MKLNKLVLGLSLSATILAVGTIPASASVVGSADTKGTIDFIQSTDLVGDIIKPETDPNEVIVPEGGNHSEGPLRLQFVPDFDFGQQELKTGSQSFNPVFTKYVYADPAKQGDQFMPQFIQVTDVRGRDEDFKVKVKSTIFQRAIRTDDKLPFATITFNNGRLSNSVHSIDETNELVSKFGGAATFSIPTGDADAKEVLGTKANKTIRGTQTSLVLAKDYLPGDLTGTATTLNKDIVFTKTNKDIPTVIEYQQNDPKDPYVAVITWTIESGL